MPELPFRFGPNASNPTNPAVPFKRRILYFNRATLRTENRENHHLEEANSKLKRWNTHAGSAAHAEDICDRMHLNLRIQKKRSHRNHPFHKTESDLRRPAFYRTAARTIRAAVMHGLSRNFLFFSI